MFLPVYSSVMNSQETVWSIVRRELFKHFARHSSEIQSQLVLEAEIDLVLHQIANKYTSETLFMAAREDIERCL